MYTGFKWPVCVKALNNNNPNWLLECRFTLNQGLLALDLSVWVQLLQLVQLTDNRNPNKGSNRLQHGHLASMTKARKRAQPWDWTYVAFTEPMSPFCIVSSDLITVENVKPSLTVKSSLTFDRSEGKQITSVCSLLPVCEHKVHCFLRVESNWW